MPDSITITHSFLQEIKQSLDDALCLINPVEARETFNPAKAMNNVVRVRAKLMELAGNSSNNSANCDKIRRGHELLRELDRVRRAVREDYGIKDAA